jgi:alanine dehydrogenase
MPGSVPRTSTIALTNATLRYGLEIAKSGLEDACKANPVIATGVNCYDGKIVNKNVAKALDLEYVDLAELI